MSSPAAREGHARGGGVSVVPRALSRRRACVADRGACRRSDRAARLTAAKNAPRVHTPVTPRAEARHTEKDVEHHVHSVQEVDREDHLDRHRHTRVEHTDHDEDVKVVLPRAVRRDHEAVQPSQLELGRHVNVRFQATLDERDHPLDRPRDDVVTLRRRALHGLGVGGLTLAGRAALAFWRHRRWASKPK
eukprot:7376642-Prymnesium_polylepis.1